MKKIYILILPFLLFSCNDHEEWFNLVVSTELENVTYLKHIKNTTKDTIVINYIDSLFEHKKETVFKLEGAISSGYIKSEKLKILEQELK